MDNTHGEAGDLHAVAHADDDAVVLAGRLEDRQEPVVRVVLRGVDAALAVRQGRDGGVALLEGDPSREDDQVGERDVRVLRLDGLEQLQNLCVCR